jgi:hypothetical protein
LRYAAEAAAPVLGKSADRLVKRVQELLGDHQDAVLARPVLREIGMVAHLKGENGFTFGLLHQLQTDIGRLSEGDITQAWRDLRQRARSRRVRSPPCYAASRCSGACPASTRFATRATARPPVDAVVSGLPWAAYRGRLVVDLAGALAPSGVFSQFAYTWSRWTPPARADLAALRRNFSDVVISTPIWRNLPPAVVYHAHDPVDHAIAARTGGWRLRRRVRRGRGPYSA